MQRNYALDGLRGMAAFCVVLSHFVDAYIPAWIPAWAISQPATTGWINNTPLAIFINGSYAVTIFFVLSGFVIAGSTGKHPSPLWATVLSRYLRLTVPVLCGVFFAWLLLKSFPHGVGRLKMMIPHPWLDWSFDNTQPSLIKTAFAGSVGVYIWPGYWKSTATLLDNPLWTLRTEMIGSLGIYALYACFRSRALLRWTAIALVGVAVLATGYLDYLAFVVGVALWEIKDRLTSRFGLAAVVAGVVLGCFTTGAMSQLGFAEWPSPFTVGEGRGIWQLTGAACLVYAAQVYAPAQRVLSSPPAHFLGLVSFPLYLIHVPMLYTVFAMLYGRIPLIALLVLYVVTALGLAFAGAKLVEGPLLVWLGHLKRWASRGATPRLQPAEVTR